MAEPRPELLVVSGDQLGRRAVLMADEAFVGRGVNCELQVLDTTVSRQHLRFLLAPGGWLVENVAANPIRINGKSYKTGRRIFLDTGDVVRVGVHSDLLFVAPGDDPDEALRTYAESHPIVTPPKAPDETASSAEASDEMAETPTDEVERVVEMPELDEPVDEEALAQKKKLRRYMIIGGAWLAVMVIVVVAGVIIKGRQNTPVVNPTTVPPLLSPEDITDVFKKPLPERTHNLIVAQRHLQDARSDFRDRDVSPGLLYRAIKNFKLVEALGGTGALGVDDEKSYRQAVEMLSDRFIAVYNSGYIYSRDQNWSSAKASFEHALALIPIKADPEPEETNVVWENVRKHLTYINGKMSAGRRRRRW
jgi:hypothetical protein